MIHVCSLPPRGGLGRGDPRSVKMFALWATLILKALTRQRASGLSDEGRPWPSHFVQPPAAQIRSRRICHCHATTKRTKDQAQGCASAELAMNGQSEVKRARKTPPV